MRLMQLMAGARHGGAEAFFERLAISLAGREAVAQHVIVRPCRERLERLGRAGVAVSTLDYGGPLDRLGRYRLARRVRRFQPDIVLSWMSRASAWAPPGRHHRLGRLGGYYDLKYFRHCDRLICNTPDLLAYVTGQGWPSARATWLPNFVTPSDGPALDRRHHAPRLSNRDGPWIAAMGRLHRNKGFDLVIDALADLPDAVLLLAGAGPEKRALAAQARRAGVADRIVWLGWQREVTPLLRAADLFVCPSRHEPLGNVILDAWAAGRPVVATRAAGPAQLITDGETGLLVPVDDVAALVAAIRRLAADPGLAAGLAGAGHRAWQAGFSEAVVVEQYLAFFRGLGACAA